MKQNVFLFTPPFTQLNTPYPATAYLKGYFNTIGIQSSQADLGIEVLLKIFSREGLENAFEIVGEQSLELSENAYRILALHELYLQTIDPVIRFLQNQDPTLAHSICTRQFLPEASRFETVGDLERAFGTMGIQDKARHFCTLYLEDINDFIVETIDPHFGFSRYAERLGRSAHSFDELYDELNKPNSFVDNVLIDILKDKIEANKPTLVAISIPFPGNLYSCFKAAQYIKANYPAIKIVFGGGYPNTELRSLTDTRVFDFVDFITLDDGEAPLRTLVQHLEGKIEQDKLKRTFVCNDGVILYINNPEIKDVSQDLVGTPDYSDLPLKKYLSVIETANPMNRLWNDGRWTKLTMAHGCYWGKCTFCDVSLDYIKNYEYSSASILVDRVEELIQQTQQTGFHFVDEAAPPALMRAFALEIIKRNVSITWWTNIRFEKSFNADLCRLLAASGCIAVSGGLEVASDRLLDLIDKGVSIEQMAAVASNFTANGIMVHAYLMYGFPTQSAQETIDSLEVVRQLFESGVVQSAFWHQFAMTEHSPIGLDPGTYQVQKEDYVQGSFANNDVMHIDKIGTDHALYSDGLKKSLFNYMHGICFDFDLQEWFDFDVPQTTMASNRISVAIESGLHRNPKPSSKIIWIGPSPILHPQEDYSILELVTRDDILEFEGDSALMSWLQESLHKHSVHNESAFSYKDLKSDYELNGFEDFTLFWYSEIMIALRQNGLLFL